MSFWTEQNIATLSRLWLSHSATQIAKIIGATKGAVIGKVDRLGLPSKPPGRASLPKKPPRPPSVAKEVQAPRNPPLEVPAPSPLSIQIMDLERHHCRWPMWPEQDGYCGHQKSESHPSYCEHHVRESVRCRG
jgi:hypothetical protein